MVTNSMEEYEEQAVKYARSLTYELKPSGGSQVMEHRGKGALIDLRRNLFLNREKMPLFDTQRWTRNFEKGLAEAWRRYVAGTCIGMEIIDFVFWLNVHG